MISSRRLRIVSLLLSLLGATACSGGSSVETVPGSGKVAEGLARFLLCEGTADELLSFSAELRGVAVGYEGGEVSDNLLSAPFRLELLSLDEFSAWLSQAPLEGGTIAEVRLSFTPFSYRARALDGTEVLIDAASDELRAPLLRSEELEDEEVRTFVTELDLLDSLVGDVADGTLRFEPAGVARAAAPGELLPVDRFIARVQSRDVGSLDLAVEAFADDERRSSLGSVEVIADGFTLLMDRNLSVTYTTVAQFFTVLVPNLTLLEVHGVLEASGDFLATRLEVEDQDGGAGATYPYKLRGTVTAISPGIARVQVRSIPRGAPFVLPILAGLGDPAGVNVSLSSQRLAVLLGSEKLTPADVFVGDEVDVKFQVFPSEPFPAVVVSIRGTRPGFRGVLAGAGGLPGSFTMRLPAGEAGVLGGAVLSSDTDVTVDVDGRTELALATLLRPSLAPGDLVSGLALQVTGDMTGSEDRPRLAAERILVRPGLLGRARVLSVDAGAARLRVSGGDASGRFGGAWLASATYEVAVEPGATLLGAADRLTALADTLATLAPGEELLVDVHGLGSASTSDRIRAHRLRSFVE